MPLLKLPRKASWITTAAALTQLTHNQLNFQSKSFILRKFYTVHYYDTTKKGEKERGCILAIFPLFTKHDLFKPLYADIKLCLVPSLGLM